MKRNFALFAAMAAGSVVLGASAAPYVVRADGSRQEGVRISARADGTIVLTTAAGQIEFTRAQIRQAVADKPAELDAAVATAARPQDAQATAAIPVLRKLMTDYRYLEWDKPAAQALARIYLGRNEAPQAVSVMEALMATYPSAEADIDLGWLYRRSLLAAGQVQKLEPQLNRLVASGSGPDAARALLIRGDLRAAEKKMEFAIRDYLRVVLFYERERGIMPEALSKAAAALEQLRDPRAKQFYQRLVTDYPNSPEAAAARGKV